MKHNNIVYIYTYILYTYIFPYKFRWCMHLYMGTIEHKFLALGIARSGNTTQLEGPINTNQLGVYITEMEPWKDVGSTCLVTQSLWAVCPRSHSSSCHRRVFAPRVSETWTYLRHMRSKAAEPGGDRAVSSVWDYLFSLCCAACPSRS